MYVELFFLRDLPLVKTAAAQRFPLGFFDGGRPSELDDLSHDALLLLGRPS